MNVQTRRGALPLAALFPLLLLVLFAFPFAGCGGNESTAGDGDSTAVAEADTDGAEATESDGDAEEAEESEPKRSRREKTLRVNASPVVRGDLVVPVIAEGTIRSRNQSEIRALITGRVEQVLVDEGTRVRKGQVIARLDDREFQVALEEARNQYLEALGKLAADDETIEATEQALTLEEEKRKLAEAEASGAITAKERRDRELALEVEFTKDGAYRAELVQVRSGLSAARAAQARAELNLENTEIRAPFAGVISELNLNVGEQLTANQVVCDLTDNVNLEAAVAVLESDLAGLSEGRSALVQIPALDDSLRLTVDVMSPGIDSESRTCEVLLRMKNEDGRLRPGMFVRAAIAGETYADCLMVPREAILTRDGRPLLFKIEDDRALWVYVTLGAVNDRMVEIEKVIQGGPLDPGSLVVISDHLTLTHQAKVNVRDVIEPQLVLAN